MIPINQILQEASNLPEDQRLTLIHQLLMIGEPDASEDVEKAWDIEIRNRNERYDQGETSSRSAGEVFSAVDSRILKT